MKKIFITLCLCFACLFLPFGSHVLVNATEEIPEDLIEEEISEETPEDDPDEIPEDTEDKINEADILALYEVGTSINASTYISDNNLYSALLRVVREDIRAKYNLEYTGNKLYTRMLQNIETIEIDEGLISSLSGIEILKLDNLKTLKITNNKLTNINKEFFENMPLIKNMDFSSNLIEYVNIGRISTLESLLLNNNKLEQIDLSELGCSKLELGLAQNKISDMSRIKFPRVYEMSLNIINNNIKEFDANYFNMDKLSLTMSIGVQNLGKDSRITLDTSTPIRYYKTQNPDLTLKAFKYNTITNIQDAEPYYTFKDADITGNAFYVDKVFELGEYVFVYYLGESEACIKDDSEYAFYECGELIVKPTACVATYEFKGKTYDSFDKKVTGKVKVNLYSKDNGTIMYKVNSGEWQTGDSVMCDQGGNYTIYTKVVVGDVESEVVSFLVRTSQNVLIPDIVMLALVLLFTLGLFMIVVPYVSKKFFRK